MNCKASNDVVASRVTNLEASVSTLNGIIAMQKNLVSCVELAKTDRTMKEIKARFDKQDKALRMMNTRILISRVSQARNFAKIMSSYTKIWWKPRDCSLYH
jgi:hypothetical protein